ncbi:MAG: 50S ribosomal protein L21e [Candidatus Altiarchaeota archaeon]|nr:50S ribosomal protein L21e [Candidatus Altiarchaeota archaeon]
MKGSQGYRRRTRNQRVAPRDRGKTKISKYLQKFKEGDVVSISIDPSYQAIPYPKFNGISGKVVGRQGRCYYIEIKDGDKKKDVIVAPEHLNALRS